MGPAFETFLTAALIILVALGLLGWFGRPLWLRIWAFFRRWYEADSIRERALKEQETFRKQAEQEVERWAQGEPITPERPPAQQDRQEHPEPLSNREGPA